MGLLFILHCFKVPNESFQEALEYCGMGRKTKGVFANTQEFLEAFCPNKA
jgi:hypothetical protein